MNNSILITGGAGHIGSNLIKTLVKHPIDYDIYCLDDYSNGSSRNHVEGAHYIRGHTKEIFRLVDFEPSIIVHLGEYARVERSFIDYGQMAESNYFGTKCVIEYCVQNDTRLVYSSSSAITNMNEHNLTNSPYTISKNANVQTIKSLSKYFNLDFSILYFYNVYGPNEVGMGPKATLIEKFIQAKIAGEEVSVTAPGTQQRNFTDVRDVVDGIIRVLFQGKRDDYFIGALESYSVLDVANMMGLKYHLSPEKLGNRTISRLDTSNIEALGWQQQHKLPNYISARLKNL